MAIPLEHPRPMAAPPGRGDGSATRLWPVLARPHHRTPPSKGLDAIGEGLRGNISRRRAGGRERRRAEQIVAQASRLRALGERALDERIEAVRDRVALERHDPEVVDQAFSCAHEAIRRELGLSLHVEQVMGALAMSRGALAEMATGEGKTVTAILPAVLDGWIGRGVHVLTVNDYLAGRDVEITLPAYRRLGLSVGLLQDDTPPPERRRAYLRPVTYGADKQFIFDYLRDRLAAPLSPRLSGLLIDQMLAGDQSVPPVEPEWAQRVVQRELFSAIIDEADSVLIDEAVTPAIIGVDPGPARGGSADTTHYRVAATIAEQMQRGRDYTVDLRLRRVQLTAAGRERLGESAGLLAPFWRGPMRREELLNRAISARELYTRDDDYIVREGKVVIVDRSTGRILDGRQWQLGVHQAVEAKEGLEISPERQTTSRISYQRYFQRYRRLCGMTGTGWEVAGELWRDYALPVVRIPTHRPVVRRHARDRVFSSLEHKERAVAERVAEWHAAGRPVLIGTRSVTTSERIGALLDQRAVPCRILNAQREAEEAEIVAAAGMRNAVTVATNMAGRGTDIQLEPATRELGGLVVIATERNEERRVDRQLYGRSGRQGDPGLAETFVSLEDDLIVRYGSGALARIARAAPGPIRRLAARLLLAQAQWVASGRARAMRAEAARSEGELEVALHHATR